MKLGRAELRSQGAEDSLLHWSFGGWLVKGAMESERLLLRKWIAHNLQKSCFLTGYGRVKTKGMVKYAFEVLSRQYPP